MKNCFKELPEPKIGDLVKVSQYRDFLKNSKHLFLINVKAEHAEDIGNNAILLYLGKENGTKAFPLQIYRFYYKNNMYRTTDPDETVYRIYNWELVKCE